MAVCSTSTISVTENATGQNAPRTRRALRESARSGLTRSCTIAGANSDHTVSSQRPGSTSSPLAASGTTTAISDAATKGGVSGSAPRRNTEAGCRSPARSATTISSA